MSTSSAEIAVLPQEPAPRSRPRTREVAPAIAMTRDPDSSLPVFNADLPEHVDPDLLSRFLVERGCLDQSRSPLMSCLATPERDLICIWPQTGLIQIRTAPSVPFDEIQRRADSLAFMVTRACNDVRRYGQHS